MNKTILSDHMNITQLFYLKAENIGSLVLFSLCLRNGKSKEGNNKDNNVFY